MKDKEQKYEESFRNFESGDYSRSDFKRVNELFESGPESELNDTLHENWQRIPEGASHSPQVKQILQHFDQHIFPVKQTVVKLMLNYYQRIAAILLIPIVLFSIYWFVNDQKPGEVAMATIVSPMGARTSFVLPDGSTGWLNSGSELTYPVEFAEAREVKLNGEAFFHVKHQHGDKFRVRTSGLTVEVLGTQFDVSAYSEAENISVVLKEGSVQILDKQDQATYLMKPDERFQFDKQQNKALISTIDAGEFTSWTMGLLQFKGESLEEVMNKLSRWYNVDIEIRDDQLKSYNFRATFKDEQLGEILKMIALTTPMKYKIEERKQNQNGIYEKMKIVIEKK
ncbi:FecR family protein [Mangrovibacterium diazotrophicum]|uniref:FecR family protein n=1 Tax=Mangrovibacterium diazotrophicum TaxID=1261403 RepID=A0A419W5L3_9BACT|nr:FecR domain-containing protein [Mangrovibacterium diazotrophicum]RKD90726.1 FecR family protein [Mangrovibacterium diazotrophicum]